MLLDKYTLTKSFENLLGFHNPSSTGPRTSLSSPNPGRSSYQPPASFVKRVNAAMTRVDPLLKTLQVRPFPPEGLVEAYLIHIGDRSDTNFRKVLELKGVRKGDQAELLNLFPMHRDRAAVKDNLVQNSPLLTPLMQSSGIGSAGGATAGAAGAGVGAALSSVTGGRGLQSPFDGASLGEKLLSAARDGVDRFGSGSSGPASGGVGLGIGVGGPAEKASINDNLKNIGKFFRRDMGGFGARFGKRDVTPTGTDEGAR